MMPAQQYLCAADLAAVVHIGLVMEEEVAVAQRLAEVGLQSGTFLGGPTHFGCEEAQGVASGGLGPVHGQIGLAQQFVRCRLLFTEEGDTDTRGAMALALAKAIRLGQHAR
jgi:hypothetical protein